MKTVSVGFVGLGAISKKMHIPVLSSFKNIEINVATEVDVKRGRALARKWGISKVYEDYNQMYSNHDLDAVFICIPSYLHYDAVRRALEHGIHVFCEKPMGLRSDDAFELVEIARKKDLVLAVGYNKRLDKNYEEARKVVKSMKMGNILHVHGIVVNAGPYASWIPSSDWFFDDKYGVIYDSASHLVDLIMHTLSDRIIEVFARGISTMHGSKVLDNIAGVFKTEKVVIGSFNVGWKIAAGYDSIQIHGTGGSVFASPLAVEARYGSYGPLDNIVGHIKSAMKVAGAQIIRMSEDRRPSETYFREDRAFIDAILHGGNPLVSGEDGFRVLKVLDAIKESIDKDRAVRVSYKT